MKPLFRSKIQVTDDLIVRAAELSGGRQSWMALVDLTDLDQYTGKPPHRSVAPLLSARELEIFTSLTYAKRQREWLGGRLAAKVCVRSHGTCRATGKALNRISILASPDGVPVLHGQATAGPLALSISHSRSYAVALAARADSCGIDIQKITDQPLRVVDRFADKEEQKILRDGLIPINEATRLTLLWSAKEAVKKALLSDRPVIFQGIRLESLQANEKEEQVTLRFSCQKKTGTTPVTATVLDDYTLAWTIAGEEHA